MPVKKQPKIPPLIEHPPPPLYAIGEQVELKSTGTIYTVFGLRCEVDRDAEGVFSTGAWEYQLYRWTGHYWREFGYRDEDQLRASGAV